MRTLMTVLTLTLATMLAGPATAAATGCEARYNRCLSETVLFKVPEQMDFLACAAEYVSCLRDAILAA